MATALLVLPAGPLSLLPVHAGGVWKAQGCGCPARASTRAHFSLWFVRVFVDASGGALPTFRVSRCSCVPPRPSLFPEPGRVAGPLRCTPFPVWCVHAPRFREPRGAPGAFRALTPKVPASELVVAFPVPRRCLPCSISLRGVSRLVGSGSRWPEKKGGRGECGRKKKKRRLPGLPCLRKGGGGPLSLGERPPRALCVAFARQACA